MENVGVYFAVGFSFDEDAALSLLLSVSFLPFSLILCPPIPHHLLVELSNVTPHKMQF